MAIRLPLKVVLSSDNSTEVGAGSALGGVAIPFTIPQDTNGLVVKFQTQMAGGGASAVLQTTDDGGSTWFDVARTSIVSSAKGVLAEWLTVPVFGFGYKTSYASVVATGSTISTNVNTPTGTAAPSILASSSFSGLPILSQQARMFIVLQAGVSASTTLLTEVKVNQQSATA